MERFKRSPSAQIYFQDFLTAIKKQAYEEIMAAKCQSDDGVYRSAGFSAQDQRDNLASNSQSMVSPLAAFIRSPRFSQTI